MLPQSGDPPESQQSEPGALGKKAKSTPDWTSQIDAELAFRLVDSILPFEACLYHQILPLSLEGSRLKLGMVNLDDTAALDYVRRILAYMNCSLVPQPLASDVHYAALSAYLNYSDKQKKTVTQTAQPVARRIAKKLAEHSAKRNTETKPNPPDDPQTTNPTLVVDSPTELPPLPIERKPLTEQDYATHIITEEAAIADEATQVERPKRPISSTPPASITTPTALPPPLEITPQYLTAPPDVLKTLPPNTLLTELLARILTWGIGRLYLARQASHGRILWSQNGLVQAILEEFSLTTLDAVIDALKQLVDHPMTPVSKPKQFELERLYQNERILLRLRLIPGQHGEEATLQVLRGAALRFYQQQQLVNLGQEALSMAQQLQNKVIEIYSHSHAYAVPLPDHLSILPELDKTLKRIGYQLNELKVLKFEEPVDGE